MNSDADEMEGIVCEWSSARGYGWIKVRDARSWIFVHIRDIVGRVDLRPDARVRFVPVPDARGTRATVVRVLEPAPAQAEVR